MKKILVSLAVSLSILSITAYASDAAKADAAATPATPAKTTTYAERLDRGKQIASAVCLACHGLNGYSPISANPNIASMPSEYIAKQLELYKSGKRVNAIMQGMAANLTPDDMKALGDYYFAQRGATMAIARNKALAERGQQIWRIGVADAKVPACAGCHGATGAGIPGLYPKLAGQWPEYSHAQLKNYASGERKNAQMNSIASRMKESDLLAVAEYMAGMRTK
jgi:cytochrome c553